MNDIVSALGLQGWKGIVSALLLPPVPWLILILVGARQMYRRRGLAWFLILLGVGAVYVTATPAAGKLLRPVLLTLPKPLTPDAISALKGAPRTAIVVLGAGRREFAPEYGMSTLRPLTMERLRYGIWLARQTNLPLAYSGGVGFGSRGSVTEAEIAARIAREEFGRPLRWIEDRSRDTSENGLLTVPPLQAAGIARVVLVTSDLHMPRALRAFERGAERNGRPLALLPAPIDVPAAFDWSLNDFLPSRRGFTDTHLLLHEWLGYWLGA